MTRKRGYCDIRVKWHIASSTGNFDKQSDPWENWVFDIVCNGISFQSVIINGWFHVINSNYNSIKPNPFQMLIDVDTFNPSQFAWMAARVHNTNAITMDAHIRIAVKIRSIWHGISQSVERHLPQTTADWCESCECFIFRVDVLLKSLMKNWLN